MWNKCYIVVVFLCSIEIINGEDRTEMWILALKGLAVCLSWSIPVSSSSGKAYHSYTHTSRQLLNHRMAILETSTTLIYSKGRGQQMMRQESGSNPSLTLKRRIPHG